MTATRSGETILLVEDDELIRRLILRTLRGQGYQVFSASDGHEALNLAEDPRGPIDLLITDVVMPRIDGFTLAERLVEAHPETRVLFLTGYADQSVGLTRFRGHRPLVVEGVHDAQNEEAVPAGIS